MNIKSIKSNLNKRTKKKVAMCEVESNSDNKKIHLCNDYATRSCLACSICWVKK